MNINQLLPQKVFMAYLKSTGLLREIPENDTMETREQITEMVYNHGWHWFESEVPLSSGETKKVKEYLPEGFVSEYLTSLKDFFTIFDQGYEVLVDELDEEELPSFPEAVECILEEHVLNQFVREIRFEHLMTLDVAKHLDEELVKLTCREWEIVKARVDTIKKEALCDDSCHES